MMKKSDEQGEMPRLFRLWKEITGEDLWNDETEKEGKSDPEREAMHERR